ncbi:hypothetical protein [Streptomyces sp. NPDC001450]
MCGVPRRDLGQDRPSGPGLMAELRGLAKDEVFGILGIRAPHLLPPAL